ncbi:hypothetical protein [Streptomyces chartreusis]|uniref:hypothetical protein n=1 Tax=Streptomyces chartreusis TaxID=1969 RepID=UPI003820BDB8
MNEWCCAVEKETAPLNVASLEAMTIGEGRFAEMQIEFVGATMLIELAALAASARSWWPRSGPGPSWR